MYPEQVDAQWWLPKHKDKRHEVIIPYVRFVEEEQHSVTEEMYLCAQLYHDTPLIGIDGHRKRPKRNFAPSPTNICEAQVDSMTASVARHRPRVIAETDGASWSLQQQAKWVSRFLEAEFERLRVYRDVTLGFRDGAVFGTACWEVEDDGDRPTVDRFLVDEIVVDERECRTTIPRQYSRRRFVDVDVIIEKYAKDDALKAEKIKEASKKDPFWTWFRRREVYQVVFIESWHLRSGPDATDGLYVACVDGVTLDEKPYKDDELPHIFFHWSAPLTGFYGRSLVRQLAPRQARLNKTDRAIELGIDLVARPIGWVSQANAALKEQIENRVGQIYVSKDQAGVTWRQGQAFGQEVFQYRMNLVSEAQFTGVSESRLMGSKPGSIDSGSGMKQVEEREAGRFAIQAEELENVYIEIAKRIIRRQRTLTKDHKKDATNTWRSPIPRKIQWSKVDPGGDNAYVISLGAGSVMNRTPTGRLTEVAMMMDSNMVDREEARELSGHPDLVKSHDLATASRRRIEMLIEKLLDEEEDFERLTPEPLMDLLLGISMVTAAYQDAQTQGAPEGPLQRCRDWIDLAKTEWMKQQGQDSPASQLAMPGAMAPMGGNPTTPDVMLGQAMPVGGAPQPQLGPAPVGMPPVQ